MKNWSFDLAEFKPEIGFEFQFLAGKDEKKYLHLCRITEVIAHKKLAYSWRYDGYEGNSYVTFELSAEGNKTRLRLTHEGIETFPKVIADFARENFVEGWTYTVEKALRGFLEANVSEESKTPVRKLIMWNLITIDGFFDSTKDWELVWHEYAWGEELEQLSLTQSQSVGTLIFGRVTYEGMARYWSVEKGAIADFMNNTPKIVCSRTLDKAEWNNTRVVKSDVIGEIVKLKQQPGKDIFVFGSADLSSTLIENELIDEFRLCIVPVVLGEGKPLFKPGHKILRMRLLDAKTLRTGGIVLRYDIMK